MREILKVLNKELVNLKAIKEERTSYINQLQKSNDSLTDENRRLKNDLKELSQFHNELIKELDGKASKKN